MMRRKRRRGRMQREDKMYMGYKAWPWYRRLWRWITNIQTYTPWDDGPQMQRRVFCGRLFGTPWRELR